MKKLLKTLTGKIMIVFLLTVIPSLTVLYLTGHGMQANWRERQIADAESEADLHAASLDQVILLAENTLLNLPVNSTVFDDLRQYSDTDSQQYWNTVVRIQMQLASVSDTYPFIENVFACYPDKGLFLHDAVNPEMTREVLSLITKAGRRPLWNILSASGGQYLCILYDTNGYYLGAWCSCDALLEYVCSFNSAAVSGEAYSQYFLSDIDGRILSAAADPDSAAENGTAADPRVVAHPGQTELLQDEVVISRTAINPGLCINRRLGAEELTFPGRWTNLNFYLVLALCVLLIASVILGIYHWVLTPIRDLTGSIEKISGGDIGHRLATPPQYSSEFLQIGDSFNHMLDQLEQMRIRFYEQELDQKETKLRYLSQQIQPHFILNSLNTLYTYSSRDVGETRKIIRLLSGYYRYVVNIEDRYVRLDQELAHLEDYLALQKIRFPSRLFYTIDCDESAGGTPVPPFLLENFISNALKYGQDEDGRIDIAIRVFRVPDRRICIRVSDGGEGFSEEVLEAIEQYRRDRQVNPLLGVGIRNCMERLSLLYGTDAEILCGNRQPHGAQIDIRIDLDDRHRPEKESADE